ncbi:MAG TPA: T9SS type A sorting domain-containing protein, partial [Bacteroidia bacterium]|nr:T9SS type A sorting domain-containing protein [Bacteroidia bacterium]
LVSFSAIEKGNYTLNVYNVEGKLMLSKDLSAENGINDNSIDVSELPLGIYQLMLSNGVELEHAKFIKE